MDFYPPNIEDYDKELPDDHPAVIISNIVESLDLSSLYLTVSESTSSYNPKVIIKILIYAYTTGTFSTRQIARVLWDSPAYMYLANWQTPDFRIIADFRKDNLKQFKTAFKLVVEICERRGLDILSHEGPGDAWAEIGASGSRTYDEKRIEREIRRVIDEAEAMDEREDNLYGLDSVGFIRNISPGAV